MSDLLKCKEESLLKYVPNFEYILYDFASYSDEEIIGTEKLKVMLYLLKYIWSSDIENRLGNLLRNLPDSEMAYLVSITVYILHATKVPLQKFAEIVEQNISKKGGEIVMTTAEQLICQGKKNWHRGRQGNWY